MKLNKAISYSLALVMSVSLLGGCGNTASTPSSTAPVEPSSIVTEVEKGKEPVKIIFWHSMGGRNEEALNKIITGFNQSQKEVVVEAQYQGTYDDAITKLRATGEGARPDIMQLYDVGTRWMINNGDENRAAAAWQFIKYATGAKIQAEWSMGTGYLPIRKSATELPEFQSYCKEKNKGMMVAIDSLRNSKPTCAGSLMGIFPKARTIIENEIEIMSNDPAITPEVTLKKICKQVNAEIELYNKTN